MPSGWIKQPASLLSGRFLNSGNGDATVGGLLTGVPANVAASQGAQTRLGDRLILGAADALAMSDNNVGNLGGGLFQYVMTQNNSSSNCTRGHGAFWYFTGNVSANDQLYRVTSDEPANITTRLAAGVFINNITKGNAGWIQVSGKVAMQFNTAITGTGAIGAGAYWTTGGNNNNAIDCGSVDVLAGANIAGGANAANFYASVDGMLHKYVGVCEVAASNNNISVVNIPLRGPTRW